jgi:hypothetical protein
MIGALMNNRFNGLGRLIIFWMAAIFLAVLLTAHPPVLHAAVLEEFRQTIETIDKRDSSLRSKAEISVTQNPSDRDLYNLNIMGKGHFSGYLNVTWGSRSVLRRKKDAVFVEKSTTSIYSGKQLLAQYHKDYDYRKGSVLWEKHDSSGKIVSSKRFSIKGPICDDVTMVYVFNAVTPVNDQAQDRRFYLLTNEPKLYHVIIKSFGQEKVGDDGRGQKAAKFQLYADLGPLTKFAFRMVPSTFVWLIEDIVGGWVKYEGMETGYETAHIESRVISDSRSLTRARGE